MIYNDSFVWLHFPKCAGTKIETLFEKYFFGEDGLVLDKIDPTKSPIIWHDSVSDREKRDKSFHLGDRSVVCSVRRLPSWLESRYLFEVQRTPDLDHQPELLLDGQFLEASGILNHADSYMKKYLPAEILNSSDVRFLRVEQFENDFKACFSDFLDLSKISETDFSRDVNLSSGILARETKEKLHDDSGSVYKACPYWKMIEDRAYS